MRKSLFCVAIIAFFLGFFGVKIDLNPAYFLVVGALLFASFYLMFCEKAQEKMECSIDVPPVEFAKMIVSHCMAEKTGRDWFLERITKKMPMKTIVVKGEAYLERYFLGVEDDGRQVWIHRMLQKDQDKHLHSHPWRAISYILHGTYTEQLINGDFQVYKAGDVNFIEMDKYHRIVEAKPGTWTLLIVDPERLPQWHFLEEDGTKVYIDTSPYEWHKDCKPRGTV